VTLLRVSLALAHYCSLLALQTEIFSKLRNKIAKFQFEIASALELIRLALFSPCEPLASRIFANLTVSLLFEARMFRCKLPLARSLQKFRIKLQSFEFEQFEIASAL
jgi:hypothetical protein